MTSLTLVIFCTIPDILTNQTRLQQQAMKQTPLVLQALALWFHSLAVTPTLSHKPNGILRIDCVLLTLPFLYNVDFCRLQFTITKSVSRVIPVSLYLMSAQVEVVWCFHRNSWENRNIIFSSGLVLDVVWFEPIPSSLPQKVVCCSWLDKDICKTDTFNENGHCSSPLA